MHTTLAFCQAPAVTSEENIAGVADQHARVVGDDIYIGKYSKLVSAFGGGYGCQTLRLVSPSLRGFFSPYIDPFFSSAPDMYQVNKPAYQGLSPLSLVTNEALNALITVSEVHSDQYNFCGVSLADGPLTPVAGEIHTMDISAAATMTIGVWTNHQLTLSQDLPVGRYAIVGARCAGNNPGIFRLVPIGEDFRPGGLMEGGTHPFDCESQRRGNMGVWCEFDQLTPPSLEICPFIANNWYALELDLIKIG